MERNPQKDFQVHRRATCKAEFLAHMEALVPWAEFRAVIEPHYPEGGNGRPTVGLERMLRRYLLANWFNLGDEACEDATSLPSSISAAVHGLREGFAARLGRTGAGRRCLSSRITSLTGAVQGLKAV